MLFLSAVLVSAAIARENPFFASDKADTLSVTSNIPDTLPKLTSVPYTLPNQARTLKEVSFTIQNLDGSIETHTMQVDQSIDWHSPIVVSQSSRAVAGDSAAKTSLPKSSVADFGFIRFASSGEHLTIKTSDPVLRHFALTDPNRIVVDFKRTQSFTPKEKTLNTPPYVSIRVANHGQFVRATITLDGRYDYTLNKTAGIISVECR